MTIKALSVEELRQRIHEGQMKDPLVFLEAIMSGQDPRRLSEIYQLVCELDDMTNGDLAPEDWAELVDLVRSRYMYHTVSLSESIAASKTLAEYLHPKRKQIDHNSLGSTGDGVATPLTKEEINLFKEVFDDEF